MAKLEEITNKAQTIRKNISAFEKLRGVCVRLSTYYYREGNNPMNEIMKLRLEKVKQKLNELYTEIIPIEKERISLLKEQPKTVTHQVVNLNIKHYESWMH
ncbi:hypothetical protein EV143_104395 [Flavobacterium chryseum]|uniref:hypothetical protein n=1 Tax=Flavobacterium sp. P3160 TaxID=2512113 RepID=UPI00106221D7|nr:hypothetical protein [Flavobacterium sp. P3160]TDO77628.1 hypothetical protein EV143_104395 [Flavobacterium sp. P3160]